MYLLQRVINKVRSIQWTFKNRMHSFILSLLDLQVFLSGGVCVKIKSLSDWMIFSDIFADAEYDAAILTAIRNVPNTIRLNVLDIGANVGFFALRVAQLATAKDGSGRDFHVICIEGSPTTERELSARLASCPAMKNRFRTVAGLAGRTHGKARINPAACHAMTSLFAHDAALGAEVPYVDLNTILPQEEPIHLLKCDIEGSEWDLIQNYENILRRTTIAVFEFHHDKVDPAACRERLYSLGLDQSRILREDKVNSIELFQRSNPVIAAE